MDGGDTERERTVASRRRYTRAAARVGVEDVELREEYKLERRNLKKLIRKEKARRWDNLCADLSKDIWGDGFKIVINSLKPRIPRVEIEEEKRAEIVEVLFPTTEKAVWEEDLQNSLFWNLVQQRRG